MNAARRGAAVLPYIGQGLQQLGADALKGGAFLIGEGQFNFHRIPPFRVFFHNTLLGTALHQLLHLQS